MLDLLALAKDCAPTVAPQTMAAIVSVESGKNPYAIGVVGGRLTRQPTNQQEAIATAKSLAANGWNFSVGVAQVNRFNLPKYEISFDQAFDACTNIRVGSKILEDCYVRASKYTPEPQAALQSAVSCYYSGNFKRGFQPDEAGKPSYVDKVLAAADMTAQAIPVVPNIQSTAANKPQVVRAAPLPSQPIVAAPTDNAPVLVKRHAEKAADNVPVKNSTVVKVQASDKPVNGTPDTVKSDLARRSAVIF